jgi:hypothetical protein
MPETLADDQQTRSACGLPGAQRPSKIVHPTVVQLRPSNNVLPRRLWLDHMPGLPEARKYIVGTAL